MASTRLLIQNEVTGRCFLSCSVFSPLSRASTSQLIQDSRGTISRDKKTSFFFNSLQIHSLFLCCLCFYKVWFQKELRASCFSCSAINLSVSCSLSFFRIPVSTSQRGYSSWGPPHPSHIIVPSSLITLLRKLGSVTHLPCCAEW